MNKYTIAYSGYQSTPVGRISPFEGPANPAGKPRVIYAENRTKMLRELADDFDFHSGRGIPTVITITLVERVEPTTKIVYETVQVPKTVSETPNAGIKERY